MDIMLILKLSRFILLELISISSSFKTNNNDNTNDVLLTQVNEKCSCIKVMYLQSSSLKPEQDEYIICCKQQTCLMCLKKSVGDIGDDIRNYSDNSEIKEL